MRKSGYRVETPNLIIEKQTPTYLQLYPLSRCYHSEEEKKIYALSNSVNIPCYQLQAQKYNDRRMS